jgi:ABC-type phosphonate transport system ATPase subunit
VVARIVGTPVEKFRWYESWKSSALAETENFVPTEHYGSWAARVEAHLDWSRKPGEVALTIYGDAGVGKTRSVFQILDAHTNHRELVLYTNDEQAAAEIATALTNDGTRNAILVAV